MEVKVLCPCGVKFKFYVEPVNGQSPGQVRCPSCGADQTDAANAVIRQQLSTAAPAPAPVQAIPAAPRIAIPAIPATPPPSTSGSAPTPHVAIPAIRAPSPAAPAAAAPAVGPKMTVMPVPETTKSLSVKPPGEATVHAAPPSTAPANSSGDPKAPGSPKMAFMPAPSAGSGAALSVSGGAPKPEPVPAQTSAPAQAAPAPAHTPAAAHPAAAKMVKSQKPPSTGQGNFTLGVVGAVVGSLIGAGIWFFLAVQVFGGWRILAWIPGLLGGLAAILLARKPSHKLGVASATVAGVVTIAMQFIVIAALDDKYLTEASEQSYKQSMATAKKAAAATTDAQVLEVMDEDPQYSGLDEDAKSFREALGKAVEKAQRLNRRKDATDGKLDPEDAEEVAEYRKKRLPELVKLSKGEPSRTRFLEKERERLKEEDWVTYDRNWFWMGIWIFSSIEAAFLLGRGKK